MKSIIFSLCIICALLAQTKFDELQIILEILLLCCYCIEFNRLKFNKAELLLTGLLLFISMVSLLINSFYVFLLNFKVYALAIFTLLYFKKRKIPVQILSFIIYLNISFVVFQYITGFFPLPGINKILGSFAGFEESRPLGLFLNTHLSAYLIAIYFLYKSFNSKLFFLAGLGIIFLTLSKFTLVSYVICYVSSYKKFFYTLIIVSLLMVSILAAYIGNIDPQSGLYSATIIWGQLTEIRTYVEAFNFFPNDYLLFIKNQLENDPNSEYANEIAYISIMIQGGIILAFFYLVMVVKYIRVSSVFILVSLLHYGFILNPLVICFFLVFEHEYNLNKNYYLEFDLSYLNERIAFNKYYPNHI